MYLLSLNKLHWYGNLIYILQCIYFQKKVLKKYAYPMAEKEDELVFL